MELLNRLEASALAEQSYFRTQLLKEDIGRLRRLQEISLSVPNLATFKKEGTMIGWTPGDTRTWELKSTLDPLLEAFYASAMAQDIESATRLDAAWEAFNINRIALLVGCLSRISKPDDD
jgi:hypothetical protein